MFTQRQLSGIGVDKVFRDSLFPAVEQAVIGDKSIQSFLHLI
jgi:hypothetical protein